MNQTGISQFNQARIEWAIRLRYSPMPDLDMDRLASQINAFRIGELRTVGKTWELMLERDGELAINSDKRKADSAGLDWQITSDGSPAGDKHAAALQYFYNNLSATKALDQDATGGVDELIYQTLSAVDYYYSAHEILLRVDNPAAQEVTAEFRHTPVWFFEARRGYLGYLKHIFDLYGQPCIAGEWLTAVNLGWMRPLSLAYGAKWMSFREWLLFSQRYGSGFLEGITDAQRDSTEWNQAAQALNQLSSDGNVLHNKGTEFKFLDQPSKNQLPFQPIVELVDRLYAKCYRGVDLATGSRGSGVPHSGSGQGPTANPVGASVQREESGILLVRDAKWVSGVFNDRIDRPILRYLFNEEPRAWFTLMPPLNDTTAEDLQALRTLVPMGMRVALKEVYQRFRWSVSNAGEPCLSAPTAALSVASGQSSVEETPGQPGGNGQPTTDNEPRTTDQQLDVQTIPALTTEATPIAPGADPARNPGLLPRLNPSTVQPLNSASRQLPDPQVDASAFWSRTALAPRGADGQVLPMPSLGYALPNASTLERLNDLTKRGLGHTRAAQALQRKIQRQQALSNQRHESASSPLPNDFDPDQLRDEDGRWTNELNGVGSKTIRTTQLITRKAIDINGGMPPPIKPPQIAVPDPGINRTDSGANTSAGSKKATGTSKLNSVPSVAPTNENIALSTSEPALMLERLLLSETKGVETPGFSQVEALKSMNAIGALIYNRTHAKELGFNSLNYPTNLLEVVKGKNQFAGFEDYNPKAASGNLSSNLLRRVDICLQGANYPKDKKNYGNYAAVVKQAKLLAQNLIKGAIDDPYSPCFTFSIRTAGKSGPGGSFRFLGTAAGNSFYGFPAPKPKNNQIHP